ncbi:MAG TPA: hypothetical protein VK302_16265 [Terriglobales bacterium]|nr:hypothetical protein [Terriglobales bacterium]
MPPDKASLVIRSNAGIPIYRVRDFLGALDLVYNYLYLAEEFLGYPTEVRVQLIRRALEGGRRPGRGVPLRDRLILRSVELHSPGWWEVVGKLNPLEQIRLYLNDRHERRKDREYRESEEAAKLRLQNAALETQVLRDRITAAREMGATDEDLAPLLDRFVRQPLNGLDRFQDEGLIENADIHPEDSTADRRPT